MGRRQHVLHVLTDSDRRGAQVFALDLHKALSPYFVQSVVALRPGLRPGAQLDVGVLGSGGRDWRTLVRLRRAIRTSDAVVAHGSNTLFACALAGAGLSVPMIYRNISDPGYWWTGAGRWRVLLSLRRYARVVALWRDGAERVTRLARLPRERVVVIGNAVQEADFPAPNAGDQAKARARLGLDDAAVVCVMVSALQPEKHPDTAVEALELLPSHVSLLLVGDGPMRADVEALAERVAPGRVRFLGQVEDVRSAYLSADVMVLPSEGEGLPAALIEAGLSQLPAVASTSGGNAEIVLDGVTGRIVPPADPGMLAAGVEAVLAERAAMGERARQHVLQNYGMDVIADQWRVLIDSLGRERGEAEDNAR